ncbi:MAG: hypothetical protein E7477_01085 [Ruminococcaceae bacterium]|nr:hypothetical protein [Oscillospiraceae bacterium]
MKKIVVNMFGGFSIREGDTTVSNMNNRSKKVWSLIAFLIYHRDRVCSQKELIDLFWNEEGIDVNSNGALKTLLYRARAELDKLFDGAGKSLIQYNGSGYYWNNEVETFVDCDKFEEVISDIENSSLDEIIEALDLFQGDFLEGMNSEFWVMSLSTYYHNLFIDCLSKVIPIMIDAGKFDEALSFCRIATNIEPYNEEVHRFYMQTCIASGNQKKAVEIYQKLSERLISELGVIASEETRSLYYEATKTINLSSITIDLLKGQLREMSDRPGALVCEYDFFKVLYYSMARSIMRSGIAVHVALISVTEKKIELTPKKLEKVMPYLEDTICRSLRRGDTLAKCSISQYVIMLPRATYENSCAVCERIIRAFNKKYIHNDVNLTYAVCPIEPDDKESFQWIREPMDN